MKPILKLWTLEQCKQRLKKEHDAGTTYDEFWAKVRKWHGSVYSNARGSAELSWADDCMMVMDKAQRELYPEIAKRGDAQFAMMIMGGKEIKCTN